MTENDAVEFAREWIKVWNAHDLEGILSHYSDEIEMSSPYVALVTHDASGTVKGLKSLREYWSKALAKRPNLHFDLLQVFCGVQSVAILYRSNLTSKNVVETFDFSPGGTIVRAKAYSEV